jgi:hypothetical protein
MVAVTAVETRNQYRDLLHRIGVAEDAPWIAELGDTLAERKRRALWGAVDAPGEGAGASRDSFPFTARLVRTVERV